MFSFRHRRNRVHPPPVGTDRGSARCASRCVSAHTGVKPPPHPSHCGDTFPSRGRLLKQPGFPFSCRGGFNIRPLRQRVRIRPHRRGNDSIPRRDVGKRRPLQEGLGSVSFCRDDSRIARAKPQGTQSRRRSANDIQNHESRAAFLQSGFHRCSHHRWFDYLGLFHI